MVHPFVMRANTSKSQLPIRRRERPTRPNTKSRQPKKRTAPSAALRSHRQKVGAHPVLAYDLGGTKVAVAAITPTGKILEEIRQPVKFEDGKTAVIQQLGALGRLLIKKYPAIKNAGIASAGPLDSTTGTLLNPTNYTTNGKSWGRLPITRLLSHELGIPCQLENDAAAALLAEHWIGHARGVLNAMILTLGTGLGTAVLADGKLLRGGRGLHTEAGHIPLNVFNKDQICGCGLPGCAETYLSGHGFGVWAAQRFEQFGPQILNRAQVGGAEQIRAWAESKKPAENGLKAVALSTFNEYADLLAYAMQSYVSVFSPELIVLTGGFASCSTLFLPKAKRKLTQLLTPRCVGINFIPEVLTSRLDNRAGVLGAGFVALGRS